MGAEGIAGTKARRRGRIWYMQGPDEMRLDLGEATLRTGAVWEFGRAPFPAISLAIQVLRGPDIPQLLADKLVQMLFSRCAWIPQQAPSARPAPSPWGQPRAVDTADVTKAASLNFRAAGWGTPHGPRPASVTLVMD